MTARFLALLVCFGVLGIGICWLYAQADASDPLVTLKDGPLSVEIYVDGRAAQNGSLPATSAATEMIDKLLHDRKGQWQSSNVSYASVLLVRGPGFKLNFQKGKVVANTKDADGHSVQVESKLSEAEYERIRKAVVESITAAGQ